jgi:hypothetical protein
MVELISPWDMASPIVLVVTRIDKYHQALFPLRIPEQLRDLVFVGKLQAFGAELFIQNGSHRNAVRAGVIAGGL